MELIQATPTSVVTPMATSVVTEPETIKHILEQEIINNLLQDKNYFTTVIHQLETDNFTEPGPKQVYTNIKNFYLKYQNVPTLKELLLSFKDSSKETKELVKPVIIKSKTTSPINNQLLLDLTEKFIKMSKFAKSVIKGATALGNHDENLMAESYAEAEDAMKVSLNEDLGTFMENIDTRFMDYQPKAGLKLGIPSFDQMIGDGYTPKTLHLMLSPSGVGKSAMLCSFACEFLLQKRDVVIISLEMAESQFMKRIDANLMNINISEIGNLDVQVLHTKYKEIKPLIGELVVKEFPAGNITPLGIDAYLAKLQTERNIRNPIVMVDYLSLVASDRMKSSDNSYSYQKSVAEELRAIAQKRNLIMFTPMQTNRSSIGNLEAGQESISDSMGVYMTADSAFLILQTKEMKERKEMKISFVKNRMSGMTRDFNINYDYNKFKIVDSYNMQGENITAVDNDFASQLSGLM